MNSRNVELNFSEINLSSLQFVSIPGTLPHEGTIIMECPPNDEIVVFLTLPFLNCPMYVCLLSHPIVIHLYPDNKFSTSCSINNSGNSSLAPPGKGQYLKTFPELTLKCNLTSFCPFSPHQRQQLILESTLGPLGTALMVPVGVDCE